VLRAGKHVYDVGVMGNGALAGLVAITSGTSTIYPWGAIIVGFIAGALYVAGSRCSILLKVCSCQLSVWFTSCLLVCSAAVCTQFSNSADSPS